MSVHTHSTDNKKYIIFSVFQGSRMDWTNHKIVTDALEDAGVRYKELDGSYNGCTEKSVLMHYDNYAVVRKMLKQDFEQESVLILENYKHGLYKASLDYLQRETSIVSFPDQPPVPCIEFIGYLRQVPERIAKLQPAWSHDPSQNAWFIVTPEDETRMDKLVELKYA